MSHLAFQNGWLALNHYGFCQFHCASKAVLDVEKQIKLAWRRKKIVTAVPVDIEGAYDSVPQWAALQKSTDTWLPDKFNPNPNAFLWRQKLLNNTRANKKRDLSNNKTRASKLFAFPTPFALYLTPLLQPERALPGICIRAYAREVFSSTQLNTHKWTCNLKVLYKIGLYGLRVLDFILRLPSQNSCIFPHEKQIIASETAFRRQSGLTRQRDAISLGIARSKTLLYVSCTLRHVSRKHILESANSKEFAGCFEVFPCIRHAYFISAQYYHC